ncbi:hypothetical protein WAJ07_21845, partial [Acinetobacter baumannii]
SIGYIRCGAEILAVACYGIIGIVQDGAEIECAGRIAEYQCFGIYILNVETDFDSMPAYNVCQRIL